jgi:hypothetical protein
MKLDKKNIIVSLKKDYQGFLAFLKSRFPLFHNSNFFFRDFQFGLRRYLELKEISVNYSEAEKISKELIYFLEGEKILFPINSNTWKINYPEFTTVTPGDPFSKAIN